MGALLIALVLGGMALAMAKEAKAKELPPPGGGGAAPDDQSPGLPTDEEPGTAEAAGNAAVAAATAAATAAAQAAKDALAAIQRGQTEEAARKAAEAKAAAEEAARAGDAAAPTPQAQDAAELARRAAEAAIKAAQAAGVPLPPLPPGTPTSDVTPDDVIVKSPGQPTQVISTQEDRAVKEAETALEPNKAPPVPAVSPQTALPAEETKPENDPNGTIALARLLLERETAPQWRDALTSAVKTWQTKLGLVADGKFGPKGGLRMAEEVGILPLVRYWSAGSQKASALADYRAMLRSVADSIAKKRDGSAHAAALRASAMAEDARAYGNPNAPPLTSAQRAAIGG